LPFLCTQWVFHYQVRVSLTIIQSFQFEFWVQQSFLSFAHFLLRIAIFKLFSFNFLVLSFQSLIRVHFKNLLEYQSFLNQERQQVVVKIQMMCLLKRGTFQFIFPNFQEEFIILRRMSWFNSSQTFHTPFHSQTIQSPFKIPLPRHLWVPHHQTHHHWNL